MMNEFKHILVGVDDSEDAILAFKYAIHLANQNNSELIIVSVLETGDMNVYEALNKDFVHGKRDDLEKHVQTYKQQAIDAGVKKATVLVAEGEPGETIVKDVIPHVKPDLLVIGSKAKKGLSRHLGSQAAYMAKYASIIVTVVR
ncbi:universal stress protein [Pediococcus ethanolidurans]|nr:universal stress protein [Pediococcus ethanolidurans]MBU7555372.1 universal stress protein [Pediococcus ethanolidurans]MBU7563590.1 universal stress protein [Pediococcus ethanolidurans]MCT4397799.1 universal stress protein [Pediococcus ethanolidurans]MCV3315050.1 universal stress protein [Pediococcus ethanolidurans]MCV3328276.1 universal stress protein [Pediococcus ethanolidurans]